jgi:hypothetical protein
MYLLVMMNERLLPPAAEWRDFSGSTISLRTPHSQRWPTIDPATTEEFIVRICDLVRLYEPGLVLNMDKTSWKLVNMNIKTIAERGADGVACWFPGDPKYCGTAIAIVDGAGEKKPMGTIAKGLTIQCEQQFRISHRRRIESRPWLSLINNVDGQTEMWRCGASFGSPKRVRENRFFRFEISSQRIRMSLSKLKRKTLA